MEQISIFDSAERLKTYEEIRALLEQLREWETDEDLVTWNDLCNLGVKVGESYFIYGTKVIQLQERTKRSNRLMVSCDIVASMGQKTKTDDPQKMEQLTIVTEEELNQFKKLLMEKKRFLFRNLVTDTFACCNDFQKCSDAKECLHQRDCFYNGCYYRKNLEQGKIFYGKNRNID